MFRVLALTLAAALLAGPALADPEAPMSTAEQIDAYLKSAAPLDIDREMAPSGTTSSMPDGRAHGFVEAGVGTGGYRSFSAAATAPLGKTGEVSIAVSQNRGRGWGDMDPRDICRRARVASEDVTPRGIERCEPHMRFGGP